MDIGEDWVETFMLVLIVLGFGMAFLVRSSSLSYLLVFFAGVVAARGYYLRRSSKPILPFILLIIGFLIGYLLGAVWTNRLFVLFFFVVGFGLSYYLHIKGIITIFKSDGYIK